MKPSVVLLAMANAFALDNHVEYRASARSAIDLGYEPTKKKRIAHRQRKAEERRKTVEEISKEHKHRNKKGRP